MIPKRHETRTDPTMNYSIVEEARALAGWSKECEALSLYHELNKIEDTRGKRGKRYKLALLLTCVLLAKMAGETTLQAINVPRRSCTGLRALHPGRLIP